MCLKFLVQVNRNWEAGPGSVRFWNNLHILILALIRKLENLRSI